MIRKANKHDIETLAVWLMDLLDHVREQSQDPYLKDASLSEELATQEVEEFLKDQASRILVAETNGSLVGFISGTTIPPFVPNSTIGDIGYIQMLWVPPNHRLEGWGRKLLESIEAWFSDQGIEYVDLHYLLKNGHADGFWKSCGYTPYRVTARKAL
ncbi:GNAT family N-acetyltransferase [Rubellicoccus peritrichatus]|uniref:GNAT family N-acetyltransferase n=1 Tax=Rubellicoccus peritrichatus TaxID=3080537 RepID=A0AAQ3LBE9_9BACT|nr:GNAT family N-acetyltransferase [Puniceicoccus sp. CR14]WOO42755.1 GNAT family N-acetyltransferase [Puniceicoccus sp. CR14]